MACPVIDRYACVSGLVWISSRVHLLDQVDRDDFLFSRALCAWISEAKRESGDEMFSRYPPSSLGTPSHALSPPLSFSLHLSRRIFPTLRTKAARFSAFRISVTLLNPPWVLGFPRITRRIAEALAARSRINDVTSFFTCQGHPKFSPTIGLR